MRPTSPHPLLDEKGTDYAENLQFAVPTIADMQASRQGISAHESYSKEVLLSLGSTATTPTRSEALSPDG